MIKQDLIFDLGFHIGEDTDFYLKKGFRVVAVEANPELYEIGKKRFEKFIKKGSLILINSAIGYITGKTKFYIHPTNTDWGSCDKSYINIPNKNDLVEIEVDSVTLTDLYTQYSVPRYMKVDVEGLDIEVARQLFEYKDKPPFVSFETSRRDFAKIFAYLLLSNYKFFQLVNQLQHTNLKITKTDKTQREGKIINYKFRFGSSGLFGDDLPINNWITYEELLSRYIKYIELRTADQKNLSMGWLDVHAKM